MNIRWLYPVPKNASLAAPTVHKACMELTSFHVRALPPPPGCDGLTPPAFQDRAKLAAHADSFMAVALPEAARFGCRRQAWAAIQGTEGERLSLSDRDSTGGRHSITTKIASPERSPAPQSTISQMSSAASIAAGAATVGAANDLGRPQHPHAGCQ